MHRTIEAITDEHGAIRLLETIPLPRGRRLGRLGARLGLPD
ncbi:MAG: hypothetical protein SH847_17670 [Roseiflexaceae bacterium]|nr:hypothetical protein [Roseiflexaceae bacterium]